MASDEEDDYMNMTFEEPEKLGKETSIQRRARKKREGEIKGRVKSNEEREADEAAARETALATALDSSNKGFKMMAKLGFKQGDALGKSEHARREPIQLNTKEDKGGIGLDSEKKRKFRVEMERETKRVKAEEGGYVERIRSEREARRKEAQFYSAQKTAERLDAESKEVKAELAIGVDNKDTQSDTVRERLKDINLLWRGLIRHRLEKEAEAKIRRGLTDRPSLLPTYEDDEEDEDYRIAFGRDKGKSIMEEDLVEQDSELDEFNTLPFAERLEKLVLYLRSAHHYCFWCKYQYPDATMDGCPGTTEEDHD